MADNPLVTIQNYIPIPSDPTVIRKTYVRIVYESQRFYVYGQGISATSVPPFDPIGKGDRFFMTVALEEAFSFNPIVGMDGKPPFVTDDAWESLKFSPSVFINAVKSVMPKLLIPSTVLPENGYKSMPSTLDSVYAGYWVDDPSGAGAKKHLFNWEVVEFNLAAVPKTEAYKYVSWGSNSGGNYLTVYPKDDLEQKNIIEMKLEEPEAPKPASGAPPGGYGWIEEPLVVSGAFVLLLNVIPETPGAAEPYATATNGWDFKIEFGEVTMRMVDAGEMRVRVGREAGDAEKKNWVSVNLMEGRTKGGPPQQEKIQGKNPYIIVVYPCWNGIIVASGVQEARSSQFEIVTTQAASVYVPKLKEAGVMQTPWSEGFDPSAPDEVFAWSSPTEAGSPLNADQDTVVDFGTEMTVTSRNCKFDISYSPVFFSPYGYFDEWFLASDDIPGEITIEYNVYPIWTRNATAMNLNFAIPPITDSGVVPPTPVGTHYNYILWNLESDADLFMRRHGELFGSIIEIIEERKSPIRNDNGNFDLTWTGGTPGDSGAGSWKDYVQNVSVNLSLDGSNGSVVVDKYGVAGQDALAIQSIGALTMEMTGLPESTVGGFIFKGLAIGTTDTRSSQGATWTIPLEGLEKKLDDIMLVNVPFMDGETLGYAVNYLSQYAGIIPNTAAADITIPLSVSEDVNVARFDWKSGTSVRTALDEVMEDTNHNYVVMNGQIYFYELGVLGLPLTLGPDWASGYPDTKIVTDDQTPNFDNLRNKIVVMGLEAIYQGEGSKIEDPPSVLRMKIRNNTTTPSFPWERSLVESMPGLVTEDEIDDFADRKQAQSSHFRTIGRTTIPGNANIMPYDQWNGMVIYSVNHNVDLVGKIWTTDLEMMGS